ncbi:MAG: hypothetical protein AAF736_19440, partial [Pseudomonadota bacterium]
MIRAWRRSQVATGCRRLLVVALIAQALLPAAFAADDPLVDLLDGEMKRYMASMAAGDPPAYFLSYRVADIHNQVVSA